MAKYIECKPFSERKYIFVQKILSLNIVDDRNRWRRLKRKTKKWGTSYSVDCTVSYTSWYFSARIIILPCIWIFYLLAAAGFKLQHDKSCKSHNSMRIAGIVCGSFAFHIAIYGAIYEICAHSIWNGQTIEVEWIYLPSNKQFNSYFIKTGLYVFLILIKIICLCSLNSALSFKQRIFERWLTNQKLFTFPYYEVRS